MVLCFHGALGPFDGGYIGVDVFFVISGFLITSLLLSELERTGAIELPRFWARRARRLLPASSLVIIATLVVGAFVLPPLSLDALARDALAASTFVINILLAHRQNDYLAVDLAPSPLLHFWSLALEEQFYLVWPLLLQLIVGYRRRVRARVGALILVLWPLSFLACLFLTRTDQPWAFFGLPTRAWELLTGAGLAVTYGVFQRSPGVLRSVVGWAGLVAIVVAALAFGIGTQFPGPAALVPVLATVAVIIAGPTAPRGPVQLLRWSPLTWIGQRSYSIYLWHWPALVLVAALVGPLSAWERAVTILGAIALAAVTYRLVEDPVRRSAWLAADALRGLFMASVLITAATTAAILVVTTAPSLAGSGAASAPVVLTAPTTAAGSTVAVLVPVSSAPAGTSGPTSVTDSTSASLPPTASSTSTAPTTPPTPPPTTAPGPDELAAINAPQLMASLLTQQVPGNLRPSLRQARSDLPAIYSDGCHLDVAATVPGPCTFGDPASPTTIVLFGDSHAAQWFPALDQIASQHHWRLLVMTKKGCPTASISVFSPLVNRELRECGPWRANVAARLAVEHPALVVMSSYRYRQTGASAGIEPNEAWRQGLTATLDTIRPLAAKVLVLGDTPTPAHDVPACLSSHLGNVTACVAERGGRGPRRSPARRA